MIIGFVLVVGSALATFGALGLVIAHQETHQQTPSITATTVTYSTEAPSETEPVEACEQYVVPSNQPRMIEAASIGLKGCIQRVGVDQHNAIAVPDNIYLAGWYTKSPTPGELGVSIIDGHVLGRYNDAIFAELHKLQAGDIVRIQFGDLSWREFQVMSTASYTVEEVMPHLLQQHTERQLNLITCSGTYNRQADTYDRRLVVRTSLINTTP